MTFRAANGHPYEHSTPISALITNSCPQISGRYGVRLHRQLQAKKVLISLETLPKATLPGRNISIIRSACEEKMTSQSTAPSLMHSRDKLAQRLVLQSIPHINMHRFDLSVSLKPRLPQLPPDSTLFYSSKRNAEITVLTTVDPDRSCLNLRHTMRPL